MSLLSRSYFLLYTLYPGNVETPGGKVLAFVLGCFSVVIKTFRPKQLEVYFSLQSRDQSTTGRNQRRNSKQEPRGRNWSWTPEDCSLLALYRAHAQRVLLCSLDLPAWGGCRWQWAKLQHIRHQSRQLIWLRHFSFNQCSLFPGGSKLYQIYKNLPTQFTLFQPDTQTHCC